MLLDLLVTENPTRAVDIGESALYALLGFLVVFVGIAFLIFVVWLCGKVMTKTGSLKTNQLEKKEETLVVENIPTVNTEEISEETVAVITAALMAYYQKTNPQCGFKVKRIKRI